MSNTQLPHQLPATYLAPQAPEGVVVPHVTHERIGDVTVGAMFEPVGFTPTSDNNGETMKQYTVHEIGTLGYGNPNAKISYTQQKEKGILTEEVETAAAELITSGACMREITDKDDGCMDGRGAIWAVFADKSGTLVKDELSSPGKHLRAKVAGGGYLTALAMQSALDSSIETVDEDLGVVARKLQAEGIICGTHSGDHEGGGKTDCGANDNLELIFQNGIDMYGHITKTIEAIYTRIGLEYDEGVANRVHEGWAGTMAHEGYFQDSNGESRYNVIMSHISSVQKDGQQDYPVSTSKRLRGDHNEAFSVLNFCEGQSFSQALFKQELKKNFPNISEDELPQAFVVDVPRIIQLAKAMASGRADENKAFDTALFAGVAYQFATAATLTDGSPRTFAVTN
ncbi:MAG: hypothetical protein WAQ24_05175 [Candidatus Saccharimonadales bacterium]